MNAIDPTNQEWLFRQLNTVYHEFAHIVHQEFKLPPSFESVSPEGYTSAGSWFVLEDQDALERGFVSPYATSSPNEDFAETVSFYLFDPEFFENYIDLDPNCITAECEAINSGKIKILDKLTLITDHYEKQTGVSLVDLRQATQSRIIE